MIRIKRLIQLALGLSLLIQAGCSGPSPKGTPFTPPPPVVTLDQNAFITNGDQITISGTCETGSKILISGDAGAEGLCVDEGFRIPLKLSVQPNDFLVHAFIIVQANPTGRSKPVVFTWTQDTQPPAVIGLGSTSSNFESVAATLEVNGSCETGSKVYLNGDSTQFTYCVNAFFAFQIHKEQDGQYTFSLSQTDAAGNTSPSRTITWTKNSDFTPQPVLLSPSQSIVYSQSTSLNVLGTCTSGDLVSLASSIGNQSQTCSNSSFSFSLVNEVPGSVNVSVTQTHAGQTSAPSEFTWILDQTAPIISLAQDVPATIAVNFAVLSFSANESVSYFCSLDSGAYSQCSSPLTLNNLIDGQHDLTIRAIDLAGNQSEKVINFTVDTSAPELNLNTAIDPILIGNDLSVSWSSDDETAHITCVLDSGEIMDCPNGLEFSDLADGNHTLTITLTNALGQERSYGYEFFVDTSEPNLSIANAPPESSASGSAIFNITSDDQVTFTCALDGQLAQPCVMPYSVDDLADGEHTLEITATNITGLTSVIPYTWTVDSQAPLLTLDQMIPLYPPGNSLNVSYSSDDASATIMCSLDGQTALSCPNGINLQDLSDGNHTLEIALSNPLGQTRIYEYSFTIDTSVPQLSVISQPQAVTSLTEATFNVSADDQVTYTCAVDGSPAQICSMPFTLYGLANGQHSLIVTAKNQNGLSSSHAFSWKVDTQLPEIIFSQAPAALTGSTSATFVFSADDSNFMCSLDGQPAEPCVSPLTYNSLQAGNHTLTVQATKPNGLTASTSYAWTIDTRVPAIAVSSAPSGIISASSAMILFNVDIPASITCKLDAQGFAPCESPLFYSNLADGAHSLTIRATSLTGYSSEATINWTVDSQTPIISLAQAPSALSAQAQATFAFSAANSTFTCALDGQAAEPCVSAKIYDGLSNGTHVFKITATKNNGLSSNLNYSWTINTLAPSILITSHPAALTTNTNASFAFTATGAQSVECKVDSQNFAPCASPVSYSNMSDGAHVVTILATSNSGIQSTASYGWTVDTSVPSLTLTQFPTSPTTSGSAVFAFTSSAATFECSLDNSPWTVCTSPITYSSLAAGTHSFVVKATGENLLNAQVTHTWIVQGLSLTLTQTPQGLTALTTATLAFSSPQASFECSLDGDDLAVCTSPVTYTALEDGVHTFVVHATDINGAEAEVSYSWTIDATPLVVNITDFPASVTNQTNASFVFTTDEPATFECKLDTGSYSSCGASLSQSGSRNYSALSVGSHVFTVRASSQTGVQTTKTYSWTIDLSAPSITITGKPELITPDKTATFSFTADRPATYSCQLDSGSFSACTSPKSYSGLSAGLHIFTVRATSSASNMGQASYLWAITNNPDTFIVNPGDAGKADKVKILTSSDQSNVTYQCSQINAPSLSQATWTTCKKEVKPEGVYVIVDGFRKMKLTSYWIYIRARNAEGLTDSIPAKATWLSTL